MGRQRIGTDQAGRLQWEGHGAARYDLIYRRVVDRLIQLGAQAIIVPTADETRWGEHEHRLHARVARTRSAEYRISIFRVAGSGISQLLAGGNRETAVAPFPGQGATIAGPLLISRTVRLPFDHWLAPFSVLVSAAILVRLCLKTPLGKFSRL